jgi:predicted O-methyltransferase YrrM
MYSSAQLALRYLQYWITASNGRGYGIHSPFVFDFVKYVLGNREEYYCYPIIEAVRERMLQDGRVLQVQDLGAGSRTITHNTRVVKDIARSALKLSKFSRLLFRLADYYSCRNILEMGTSLGITTAYLASACYSGKVYTLEGVPDIAGVATENLHRLHFTNVQMVQGNFDETISDTLAQMQTVDLVYVDGNHRKEPTLRYFDTLKPYLHNDSIIVFDDVHWSREMEEAWRVIKQDSSVRLSIDLFFLGIVFFRPEFKQVQHFSIRY